MNAVEKEVHKLLFENPMAFRHQWARTGLKFAAKHPHRERRKI